MPVCRHQRCDTGMVPVHSAHPFEQLARLAFQLQPRVLIGLGPGMGGNSLHEIIEAFRRVAFFDQHGGDDLRGLRLGETAFPQEVLAVIVLAGDDPLAGLLDPMDEVKQ